jgi:hypothetical protein
VAGESWPIVVISVVLLVVRGASALLWLRELGARRTVGLAILGRQGYR